MIFLHFCQDGIWHRAEVVASFRAGKRTAEDGLVWLQENHGQGHLEEVEVVEQQGQVYSRTQAPQQSIFGRRNR